MPFQTKESPSFWLRSFVEQQAKTQTGSAAINEDYRERPDVCRKQTFCGIVTQACEGVVDAAAEGDLDSVRFLTENVISKNLVCNAITSNQQQRVLVEVQLSRGLFLFLWALVASTGCLRPQW